MTLRPPTNIHPSLRCLTIRQPWAGMIVRGEKAIENRTWRTRYSGWVVIHAATNRDRTRYPVRESGKAWQQRLQDEGAHWTEWTLGAAIGVAYLSHCLELATDRAACLAHDAVNATGPYCWLLRHARLLEQPITMSGKLGLPRINDPAITVPVLRVITAILQEKQACRTKTARNRPTPRPSPDNRP
jgi:hypothetical protein